MSNGLSNVKVVVAAFNHEGGLLCDYTTLNFAVLIQERRWCVKCSGVPPLPGTRGRVTWEHETIRNNGYPSLARGVNNMLMQYAVLDDSKPKATKLPELFAKSYENSE